MLKKLVCYVALCYVINVQIVHRGPCVPQGQHCSKIMKPPQSLPLQMAEPLRRAKPDSVANHVTARSIND